MKTKTLLILMIIGIVFLKITDVAKNAFMMVIKNEDN